MKSNQGVQWWKEAVIYQVYPRSFQDSNGDGIGDLPGLISRLDYLKSLGVDVLWLCPFYSSPNDDNGYDISDYYGIMAEFGTMEDFERLLAGVKERKMKMIIDLVVNHSSDEHAWFQESRDPDSPKRDWYTWKKPKPDGSPPNDWKSIFAGSAWEWDDRSESYFLHLFSKKQPDLNWENAELREAVYTMMRWWLDKGVDGFRMDVVPFFSKDLDYPDYPEGFDGDVLSYYANGPKVHEYLQEMNREVMQRYDCFTVGEGPGVGMQEALLYVGESRNELDMVFHFGHMTLDRVPDDFLGFREWSVKEMKDIFIAWDEALAGKGWNSIFLGNHDFPRIVSRFGNDGTYHKPSAKCLATLLMTLRGTPYVYQGDEIGMTNTAFEGIHEYRDLNTLNFYEEWKAEGKDVTAFVQAQLKTSRDHARTPIQWSTEPQAGFTTGEPWLRLAHNWEQINVATQEQDPESILNYYRKAIAYRKRHKGLVYGDMEVLHRQHTQAFVFLRKWKGKQWLVALNLSDSEASITLPDQLSLATASLHNYADAPALGTALSLRPWEAVVFE
ncbi:MAG TPA: glucohydrolase [Cytophagales bacterium]|nr:glucohydrolase [Cytophagales bacterium]HAA20124.1 glucohydrolase [Cytophagales bacterium]HAP64068.1 glucohydrolase [Cytophagales bacterium]